MVGDTSLRISPGVENRLEDGISIWPEKETQENVTRLTQ